MTGEPARVITRVLRAGRFCTPRSPPHTPAQAPKGLRSLPCVHALPVPSARAVTLRFAVNEEREPIMTDTTPEPAPAYTVSAADYLAEQIAKHQHRAEHRDDDGPAAAGHQAAAQHLVDTLTPGHDLAQQHPSTSPEVATWLTQTLDAINAEVGATGPATDHPPAYTEAYVDTLGAAATALMVADTLRRDELFDRPIPGERKSAEGAAFTSVISEYEDRGEFEVGYQLRTWHTQSIHAANERFFANPSVEAQALHAARLTARDHPTPPHPLAAATTVGPTHGAQDRPHELSPGRDHNGPEL